MEREEHAEGGKGGRQGEKGEGGMQGGYLSRKLQWEGLGCRIGELCCAYGFCDWHPTLSNGTQAMRKPSPTEIETLQHELEQRLSCGVGFL